MTRDKAGLTPEQRARVEIDRQLKSCGWHVQSHARMNIRAGLGVAVREFPLKTGFADYLLYVDGKAIGVVEAKPEGFALTGVETQSAKYTEGLPAMLPQYVLPLPFAYESTGVVTQFTNGLDPVPRSREVFTFHRPQELLRLVSLKDNQLRQNLRTMPELNTAGLWQVQEVAIRNLEQSLSINKPRALIQMATGSGKTFTACSFCYRLIKFAKAKRILFLVDRNNLGEQTLNEFQQFASPYTNRKFTEEYNVQHLKKNTIDPASKVVITTIQRLYSILKGEEEFAEENEEMSLFEADSSPLLKEALPVVYNEKLPLETFDFIVIDECHRSIYNIWRQVLEYFDAYLIGLTATPTMQTIGFFQENVVQDYSHEKAVMDGVNVGHEVYRIRTAVTEKGAKLEGRPGHFVPRRDRRTHRKRVAELDQDVIYSGSQLDRDVVNLSQIRLVVKTFKEKLFSEIFPGRKFVPKTLVFAKTDLHADDIVKIIRDEFGEGNQFCQKITSKTTGIKPKDLLQQFRTAYYPRIAVTVDMIATGTDVKPLECLLFMRNINSAAYFEQMKGRGCRIVKSDDLRRVTSDAKSKTHFVIVDAVGVCESEKTTAKPLDRKPSASLKDVLQLAAQGVVHADVVSTLAARLAKLGQEIDAQQEVAIAAASGGKNLANLANSLLQSIDPDRTEAQARQRFNILEPDEPSEEQLDPIEHENMSQALQPFCDPDLRDVILQCKADLEQLIDGVNIDQLIKAGFDSEAKKKAESVIADFRQFIEANKDKIEALRLLYSKPYRSGLRFSQVKELSAAIARGMAMPQPEQNLWQSYQLAEPEKVKGQGGNALVDLIALVRHALRPEEPLVPVAMTIQERYEQWLAEQAARGTQFTAEQLAWLEAIRDHVAQALTIEADDFAELPFSQMGGLGKLYQLFGERYNEIIAELNERLAA